jgi:hypothetical protein
MNENCCKELSYKLASSILKNKNKNSNHSNTLKQFETCLNLKNLGKNKMNCKLYENKILQK